MKTLTLYGTFSVGDVLLVHPPKPSDPYQTARSAKRTVNADGSPRKDLWRVRVVKVHQDTRRLTEEAIEDGARNVDRAEAVAIE